MSEGVLIRQLQAAVAGLMTGPVAALPSPAFNGQLCLFQTAVMEAAGIPPWLLRYRATNGDGTANASAFKWEPLGAPTPLFAVGDGALEDIISTTYVAPTTKLGITLPLAGDYDIEVGHASWHTVTGGSVYHSYQIATTPALDADAAQHWSALGGTDTPESVRVRRKTGLAAGSLVETRVRVGAITGKWRRPWMRITPVRVG